MKISSLPPIVNEYSKVLILGSIPGIRSLEMQQYYAHPQNKFWNIMLEILNERGEGDYSKRVSLLLEHGIALWDVLDTCERKGSLDARIQNEETNKILEFIMKFPSIQAVFCNGRKSFQVLQKMGIENFLIPIFILPSTSPAYASISLNEKVERWKKIKQFLP